MFREVCKVVEACGERGPRAKCRECVVDLGLTAASWQAAMEADAKLVARHEAAHAVISLALGRDVRYVSVQEEDPHVSERGRADGPRWLHDALFVTLAGELAEGRTAALDYEDCRARIAASRRWLLGSCDDCTIAFYLASIWGEGRSDDELALLWGHMRSTVLNLLSHPAIVEAIERLAERLGRRRLLLADDLAVIVNATALRAAAAEVLSPVE